MRIGKDFVGGLNFSEEFRCSFRVIVIPVGMELKGFALVCLLDPIIVGVSRGLMIAK